MEFVKKNWVKIVLAACSLVCAILMLVPVFILEHFNFTGSCPVIGLVIFFAGIATVFCVKMFDKIKKYAKFLLLSVGVLVSVFLLIGTGGFSKGTPEGALGKAYAYFANVEPGVDAGEAAIAANEAKLTQSKADVAGLEGLNAKLIAGLGVPAASGGLQELAGTQVKNLPDASEDLIKMRETLKALGFGDLKLMEAPVALGVYINAAKTQIAAGEKALADGKAQIADGKTKIRDANAASLIMLYLYICLIISMGAVPIVIAVKKILCKKEDCCQAK